MPQALPSQSAPPHLREGPTPPVAVAHVNRSLDRNRDAVLVHPVQQSAGKGVRPHVPLETRQGLPDVRRADAQGDASPSELVRFAQPLAVVQDGAHVGSQLVPGEGTRRIVGGYEGEGARGGAVGGYLRVGGGGQIVQDRVGQMVFGGAKEGVGRLSAVVTVEVGDDALRGRQGASDGAVNGQLCAASSGASVAFRWRRMAQRVVLGLLQRKGGGEGRLKAEADECLAED
mmetsp:Transcript_21567/g.49017  ORF Transcript_21567/g.49017 Transcript_21567/m.49017 type:complete len:230 (-) Transcript_21567:479-1168(-)